MNWIVNGVTVNVFAIVFGGIVGLIAKKRLYKYEDIINKGIGVSIILLGISIFLTNLEVEGVSGILFIIAIVIGGVIGEWLNIEDKLNKFGYLLEKKFAKGDANFSKAFITGSLLYCVGSMAILGSIDLGIRGDSTILYTKSVLDGVTSAIIASSLGVGILVSAVSVFIYQGSLVLLSGFLVDYLTERIVAEISVVGGVLIVMIGLNFLKLINFKVANYLPSLLIPIIYYIFYYSFIA